jgi:hypothetical protein
MEPASTIISICGGVAAVAEMVGRDETRVRRWTYPKDRGGTGGLVPSDCQQPLLEAARAKGLALTPENFFIGYLGKEAS